MRLCATVNTTTQNVFREAYTSKHKTTLATLELLIITNSEKHYLMFGWTNNCVLHVAKIVKKKKRRERTK